MQWFRWYHGTATDMKFGRVARATGQTRERVVFVWAMILESASESEPRGHFDIEPADIADVLHCDPDDINAIMASMCDAAMIDTEGELGVVCAWQKRQPSRDDTTARQRKKRERDADVTRKARDSDADVTPPETDTDSETDKNPPAPSEPPPPCSPKVVSIQPSVTEPPPPAEQTTEQPPPIPKHLRREPGRRGTGSRLPDDWSLPADCRAWAEARGIAAARIDLEAEKFRDYWHGKPGSMGRKCDWPATWRNWIRRALEDRARRPGAEPPRTRTGFSPTTERIMRELNDELAPELRETPGHDAADRSSGGPGLPAAATAATGRRH